MSIRVAKAVIECHPIGCIAEPEEAAPVIAFLASDDASYMTGSTAPIDGGRRIRASGKVI
jgi:NAD(P)-dependent dehydrogenase (short-subunit alcohol dehydrogenase family)